MAYPNKAKFNLKNHPKIFLNFDQVFRDVKVLGSGGFGSTHLIQDKISGKKYALKLLHLKEFDRDTYYREVSALINLSAEPSCDPNIVCYYNHFILQGFTDFNRKYVNTKYYAILMEYIEGMTLANFDEKYQLSINDILYLGLWVLDVLKYLHTRGFAHNDISAQNIMVTNDKQLKLIDFGITCNSKSNGFLKCTIDRSVNLYYESPELHSGYYTKNPNLYSKTSDIYAVGILLYMLLTNKRPYDQNKNLDIISPYHEIRNYPCINKALKNMLVVNPNQRATATQGYNLLKQCL
jgi:eukaryotic-like serine/threonine-protein kinase